ncbi:uncharacterized protein V6R79_016277 [Siganus canaliculatus]
MRCPLTLLKTRPTAKTVAHSSETLPPLSAFTAVAYQGAEDRMRLTSAAEPWTAAVNSSSTRLCSERMNRLLTNNNNSDRGLL